MNITFARLGISLLCNTKEILIFVNLLSHYFCNNSKSTMNMKVKFWEDNEKNMNFLLASKSALLPGEPSGVPKDRHKDL